MAISTRTPTTSRRSQSPAPIPNLAPEGLLLPQYLWGNKVKIGRTRLIKLVNAYNAWQEVEERIAKSQINYQETHQQLIRGYDIRIQQTYEELKEKINKEGNEFSNQQQLLEQKREETLEREIEILEEYRNSLQAEFDRDKGEKLSQLAEIINSIDELIRDYALPLDINHITPLDTDPLSIPTEDIIELVVEISDNIINKIESSPSFDKVWHKVKNMSNKKVATLGATAAVSTILFAPVVAVGSTALLGASIKVTAELKQEIQTLSSRLYKLRILSYDKYQAINQTACPNIDNINQSINDKQQEINQEYQQELQKLNQNKLSWQEQADNLNSQEIISPIEERKQTELVNLRNAHTLEQDNLTKESQKLKAAYLQAKEEFLTNNQPRPLFNDHLETISKNIKEAKNNLQDFMSYSDLSKLTFGKNDPNSQDPLEVKRALYDQELEKVLIPKYKKCLQTASNLEEFNILYKQTLQAEDEYYYLDFQKVLIGELIQSDPGVVTQLSHIRGSDPNSPTALPQTENYFGAKINNKSMLMFYNNEEEQEILINLTKYLVQQVCAHSHPNAVEVNIVNKSQSTAFNDITIDTTVVDENGVSTKNGNYITNFVGDSIKELVSYCHRTYANRDRKIFVGGGSMSEAISNKRASNSMTPKYIINIILDPAPSSELDIFNIDSDVTGIMNIRFMNQRHAISQTGSLDSESLNNDSPRNKKSAPTPVYKMPEDFKDKFLKNGSIVCVCGNTPNSLTNSANAVNSANTRSLALITKANNTIDFIKYKMQPPEEIRATTDYLKKRYMNMLGMKSTPSVTEFIAQLSGGKYFQEDSTYGLKIHCGYLEGDRGDLTPIFLDEKDKPHLFVAGTTGGGKSVWLNLPLNCIKVIYSPEDVVVWYYDFKVVEAMIHAYPYQFPHCQMISGSSTADYIISVMEQMVGNMKRIYEIIAAAGFTNYSSYRKHIDKLYKEAIADNNQELAAELKLKKLPRTLLVIDELVAGMLTSDEAKEAIVSGLRSITSLARAAGMHLLCLTQAPPSQIPDEVFGLFAMRGCTKASVATSKAVLGNDFAARPENQFLGFFGVNTDGSRAEEFNRMYLVPFSSADETKQLTLLSNIKCDEVDPTMKRKAVIFSDSENVDLSHLDRYLQQHPLPPDTIFFGDVVRYQPEYAPAQLYLACETSNNLVVLSSIQEERLRMLKIIAHSVNMQAIKSIMFFSKQPPPNLDIDKIIQHPFLKVSEVRDRDSHEVIPYVIVPDQDTIDTKASVGEDVEYLITQENYNDLITANKIYLHQGYRTYFSNDDYARTVSSYASTDTSSMYGKFIETVKQLSDFKSKKYKGVPKSEIPKHVLYLYQPELDSIVISENYLNRAEYKSIIQNAPEWGVFIIIFTQTTNKIADNEFANNVLAKNVGLDNETEKMFKNIEPNLARLINKQESAKTFKIKLYDID